MAAEFDLAALLAHPANGGLAIVAPVPPSKHPQTHRSMPEPELVRWNEIVLATGVQQLRPNIGDALAVLICPPPDTPWQQDSLLRRVSDLGYRILTMPDAERFGDGSRLLAERLGLALLTVDDPAAVARAGWEIGESRDALTLGYVRRVAQSIAYPAAQLTDLLRHLSASVGHAVALVDSEGVLHQAGGTLPDAVHAEIDFGTWLDIVDHPQGSAASVHVESAYRSGLRLVLFDRFLNTVQRGALGVAAEVAMPAVAARLLIDEVADVNDASVASGLLRDFLEQKDSRDVDLERRMAERGWRTTGYHLGFRMQGMTRINPLELLPLVANELAPIPTDSHVVTSGRGVTGWLSFAEPPSSSDVESYVAAIHSLHITIRKLFSVATGVGTLENGSAGLILTIDGASDAARLAASRAATEFFVRIDTLGVEQMLLSWTESDTFVPAARTLLAPLVEHDPDLLVTLTAFLDHESGIAATATALGLHRNTVSTRIARAQALLGLDLSNAETRLAVHLACRAVEV